MRYRLPSVCAVLVLTLGTLAHAVVVTPTGVTHNDADFGTNSLNLINGSGLSNPGNPLGSTHAGSGFVAGNVWLSNGGAGQGNAGDAQLALATLTFDFASAKDLSGVHVWQYTQGPGCCQGRAVDSMTVSFSTNNGATFSNDIAVSLPAPNPAGPQPLTTISFGSTIENVTNVRFSNMSDFDALPNPNFVGFSEIRFDAVVGHGFAEITNGSFEVPSHGGGFTANLNPAFSNWSNVGGQGNLGDLDSGLVSAATPDGSAQWAYFRDNLGLTQQIGEVNDGSRFEFAFDQSTQTNIGDTGGGVFVQIFAGDPNGGGTLLDEMEFGKIAPGLVERRFATLDTGYGFEGADLFLVLRHNGSESNVLIDNVTVTTIVPEPTTAMLGLVALAGLGFRRRRRA